MKLSSWTRAAPFKEEKHHRTPSESIANNYSPTANSLKLKNLRKRRSLCKYLFIAQRFLLHMSTSFGIEFTLQLSTVSLLTQKYCPDPLIFGTADGMHSNPLVAFIYNIKNMYAFYLPMYISSSEVEFVLSPTTEEDPPTFPPSMSSHARGLPSTPVCWHQVLHFKTNVTRRAIRED